MRKLTDRPVAIIVTLIALLLACNFPTYRAYTGSQTPTPLGPVPPGSPTLEPPMADQGTAPSTTPAMPVPAAPVPSATPLAFQPTFVAAPCAFSIPRGGYRVDCGYVAVPANRDHAQPGDLLVRLHVAVFHSWANLPAPDPVVHLAGGPGSSSLGEAEYVLGQGLARALDRRDLIFFDQRGTGFSLPRLDCSEREDLTPALLDGSLTQAGRDAAIVDAFRRCHNRLVQEGIDPADYTSAASAADVNDLRRALGYPQVNLYADSYGTRLALTVLRDFPDAVRSAVLDSVYPPQVNLYTTLAPNAERSFRVLFERCAADEGCSQYDPNLENAYYDLVDQLNASPVTVKVKVGGADYPVLVDGNRLVDVLLVGLYNPAVIAEMPLMISQIQKGEYGVLRQRLALYFDHSVALGMNQAIQCNEEIPFSQPDEPFRMAQGVRAEIARFFPADVQSLFTACKDWQTRPLDPRENQPVSSDVPALVLAGGYDPITPPEWGRMAARTLTHAYFFEFPHQGHWVTRSSRCALEMSLAFWNDPTVEPDPSCIAREKGIVFVR
ncbi:MAG TPA: alpha/beta fold hydrolase [Anaerolineaceae bacterium]|nr:alpha/beta fold hydrolase [Anaerolineaceae bacterium]